MQSQDLRQLLASAITHHQAGRLDEAEAIYREILAADPNHVDSLHLSGVIANQRGDHEAAIKLIGKAIALSSRGRPAPQFHNNIAAALRALGRLDTAAEHYRQAVSLKPDYVEAYSNLGAVLQEQGKVDEAVGCFRTALALRADYPKAHYGLGVVLHAQNKLDESLKHYEQALALRPDYPEALNNLGLVLRDMGKLEDAAQRYEQALALDPDYVRAHYNLGIACEELGKLDAALESYKRAQTLSPEDADFHWNEALVRLLRGEYAAGWEKYEWRWRRTGAQKPHTGKPSWDGAPAPGKTILLHAEQGFGDTIQFIRYAALVRDRAAKVVVECPPSLKRLVATAPGVDQVVTWTDPSPAFDMQAPLLSLPRLFGTTVETVPAAVPYLRAEPDLTAAWRSRLTGPGYNVGIVWRGNPGNTINPRKSVPPPLMAKLCAVPGVNWISVQADARADELTAFKQHGPILDAGPSLTDWAETAALLSVLDLVITVDTGVAHLAGALGKPAWVLLSHVPDWRWLMDRSDSPWYPTLKLFRQPAHGDWESVLTAVESQLRKQVGR